MFEEYCHGYRFANPLNTWIVITPHDSKHSKDILELAQDPFSKITGIIFLDNKEIAIPKHYEKPIFLAQLHKDYSDIKRKYSFIYNIPSNRDPISTRFGGYFIHTYSDNCNLLHSYYPFVFIMVGIYIIWTIFWV